MEKKLIIIGAGGAGREIAQIAYDISSTKQMDWSLYGFIDDSYIFTGENILNIPVLGNIENWIPKNDEVFICSIAKIDSRKKIIENLEKKGATFINLIHPTAIVSEFAIFEKGLVVYPFTVISTNVKIGKHVMLNMHNSIGHDAKIGNFSVLSSFCDVTGYVSIGESVFLGSHVTIAPNLQIGNNAIVGIGSVVVNSVKNGKKVFGNPSKSLNL